MVATKLPLPMLSRAVGRVVLTALMYMTAVTYIYSTWFKLLKLGNPDKEECKEECTKLVIPTMTGRSYIQFSERH